ncbi:MAG: response regulator transcription factor [Rhodospirillales bacterium]|nr:response regulator transcription factor [Rhodospirillales bacterium]
MKNDMASVAFGLTQRNMKSGLGMAAPAKMTPKNAQIAGIKAALMDCYSLSRDCIIGTIHALGSDIDIIPFSSIRDCINYIGHDLNIIVYYCHDEGTQDHLLAQEITTLRQAFSDVPIIVLSDAKQASEARIAKAVIRAGARGFIATRTVEMAIVLAAIRYVSEGGMIVPVDLLFSERLEDDTSVDQETISAGLTSRQVAVLAHLKQGKPNKIIAHDLRMSESTVKVHIRNIMRKMGATNRTQAVYKARELSHNVNERRV